MTEGRSKARSHRRRRHPDRWFGLIVVVIALAAGGIAARFGSHQAWENQTVTTTTTVPSSR
jgi:predicted RNA binding protein YcfA (HicA-like mRNA interferase family)